MGTDVEKKTFTPESFIMAYGESITSVLPSHVTPKQWLAVALDAVKKDPNVYQAALNDMRAFTVALRGAARMGLEPGTEQFYLVPFSPTKGAPRIIQGIAGYQGLVELMYRAGAVKTVKAEVVYANDVFEYTPSDDVPRHTVEWFQPRGEVVGAYAYAVMDGGAVSKVVMVGPREIESARSRSASARSSYSPWAKDYASMVLKTAVRQLAKWVPTSAEYRRAGLRAAQDVWDERLANAADRADLDAVAEVFPGCVVDPLTGEIEFDVVDGEIVNDAPPVGPSGGRTVGGGVPGGVATQAPPTQAVRGLATEQQVRQITALGDRLGMDDAALVRFSVAVVRTTIKDITQLGKTEAARVIAALEKTDPADGGMQHG
ncbi:MAG: recombinase RecT [Propionibacteriaceae bacterium]|nr:recombinase RecT [Propionibacteriaceae bacterium]